MRTRTLAVLGAAMSACALSATPAMAATITVDDDRRDCKKAQFQSINAAVQAAAPGDTINVCRGLYAETVVVNKPLTLNGARNGNGAAPGRQQDESKESVVVNAGNGGFDVSASGVTITGFTVKGNPAAASYPNAGVYLRTGANRVIERNVLKDNGLGVYIENSHTNLEIEKNAFVDNRRDPNPSFIPAGGIFAAGGPLSDVEIDNNYFTGNAQFSVNIGSPSTGLQVNHNKAVDDGAFLVIGGSTDAVVEHNNAERHSGSGVFAFGDNEGLRIAHNRFLDGVGTGINLQRTFGATTGNVGLVVEHNQVRSSENNGIRLLDVQDSLIQHNLLIENDLRGIRVDAASTGNRIERNRADDNLVLDCQDDSAGPGTSGTANFWIANLGDTESRPGICKATGNE